MIVIKICQRCQWANQSPRLLKYHDQEWGVPQFDEQKLFEALSLEIFQAGLQWELILKKRSAIRKAFNHFDYRKVAKYSEDQFKRLLNNSAIIRNRAKITVIIHNAKVLVKIHCKGLTLKRLTWLPVNNVPLNHLVMKSASELDNSKFIQPYLIQFRYYNFKRIGPKTLYSYLQAVGVVNDHLINCFRHAQISKLVGEKL